VVVVVAVVVVAAAVVVVAAAVVAAAPIGDKCANRTYRRTTARGDCSASLSRLSSSSQPLPAGATRNTAMARRCCFARTTGQSTPKTPPPRCPPGW
jgi:hypothetical protein